MSAVHETILLGIQTMREGIGKCIQVHTVMESQWDQTGCLVHMGSHEISILLETIFHTSLRISESVFIKLCHSLVPLNVWECYVSAIILYWSPMLYGILLENKIIILAVRRITNKMGKQETLFLKMFIYYVICVSQQFRHLEKVHKIMLK